ncbi:carbohydrate ABC transporter permease [Actinomadura madurae]|uniref:carbohydrate ABC transporter permease n=1 Tax=Actinomadura madurae TaxID=1993 RepID=UPI00202763EE|nr:sugar ABC transporter permease [Actinomadura madurae]MCP9954630.1 sugar ABC transporter permease [Actinomadura madurae]MCP9971363.1 sugar ABC transporter permease [Actinomadura madurae]MCP9983854.1 sugar ABC transporter permease [Actinomadura madurae]MCQ0004578.1 sugar ABC transporter permease [Actinomadura madurae]MCQ0020090.1 sugar ABC transporter permease [Actinomadura madurae]
MTTVRTRARPSERERPAAPRTPGRARRSARRNLTAYGFLSGALICFAFFSWYPIVREVLLSFQRTNFVGDAEWVGLENFRTVIRDPVFVDAWVNTAIFTLLALVIGYVVPFAIAIVLNELRHARGYLRFVVYLPVMLPPAVAVLLFKWFYDPGPGLFNQILGFFRLPGLSWLDSTSTALVSLVLVSTWMNLGSGTLIYLAALQTIPGELYEAAELDGAGLFRRIRHITIPQTRLILLVMLLLQIIATMQVFIEPFLLTGGGPEDATVTVAYLMYQYAFNFTNFGGGGALGLMLMLVLIVFSVVYLRVSREEAR